MDWKSHTVKAPDMGKVLHTVLIPVKYTVFSDILAKMNTPSKDFGRRVVEAERLELTSRDGQSCRLRPSS
jgi:hypothetical protein